MSYPKTRYDSALHGETNVVARLGFLCAQMAEAQLSVEKLAAMCRESQRLQLPFFGRRDTKKFSNMTIPEGIDFRTRVSTAATEAHAEMSSVFYRLGEAFDATVQCLVTNRSDDVGAQAGLGFPQLVARTRVCLATPRLAGPTETLFWTSGLATPRLFGLSTARSTKLWPHRAGVGSRLDSGSLQPPARKRPYTGPAAGAVGVGVQVAPTAAGSDESSSDTDGDDMEDGNSGFPELGDYALYPDTGGFANMSGFGEVDGEDNYLDDDASFRDVTGFDGNLLADHWVT